MRYARFHRTKLEFRWLAHELYRQFGFAELANPARMMELVTPDVYKVANLA